MGKYLYVEYATGERELYDLSLDPYQLKNAYKTADPALVSQLKSRLGLLRNCARVDCRTAEGGS
jgi:N-acetylglucosamine-6-sulfatase